MQNLTSSRSLLTLKKERELTCLAAQAPIPPSPYQPLCWQVPFHFILAFAQHLSGCSVALSVWLCMLWSAVGVMKCPHFPSKDGKLFFVDLTDRIKNIFLSSNFFILALDMETYTGPDPFSLQWMIIMPWVPVAVLKMKNCIQTVVAPLWEGESFLSSSDGQTEA